MTSVCDLRLLRPDEHNIGGSDIATAELLDCARFCKA